MMKVQIKGAGALASHLAKIKDLQPVKDVVRQNGAELQQRSQRFVPVRTGDLKRSIMLELEDAGMTAHIEAHMSYAPYVEYGTRFMSARPYMRPAYEVQKRQFISDLQKLVR